MRDTSDHHHLISKDLSGGRLVVYPHKQHIAYALDTAHTFTSKVDNTNASDVFKPPPPLFQPKPQPPHGRATHPNTNEGDYAAEVVRPPQLHKGKVLFLFKLPTTNYHRTTPRDPWVTRPTTPTSSIAKPTRQNNSPLRVRH